MKAIIVDDEQLGINSLQSLLEKHCPKVEVINTTTSPEKGVELINKQKPDVLFLDIEMPTMDGFALLNELRHKDFHLIFTTAHDEFAIQAIKTAALDYLLKPISKDELISALDKARELHQQQNSEEKMQQLLKSLKNQPSQSDTIGLPILDGLQLIATKEIRYCKSTGNYTELFLLTDEKLMISKPIGWLENKLNPTQFVRVHNSYLVNLKQVKKYLKGRGGSLVLHDETIIPVSSRRKQVLMERL